MKSLKEIFLSHAGKVTDKWQFYIEAWDDLFAPYRHEPVSILEIGIQNGGSLEVWAEYFTNAQHIVGCDIEKKCAELRYDDEKIKVVVGDVLDEKTFEAIKEISREFAIIIDDGSHLSSDMIKTFARYFSLINNDGIYVVEDMHASYWSVFEGGLDNPYSAKGFFCRLVDVLNFEHWHKSQSRTSHLNSFFKRYDFDIKDNVLATMHSITFLNSLCIVKKKSPEINRLGLRIVRGSVETVTEDWLEYNNTNIQDISKPWVDESDEDIFKLLSERDVINKRKDLLENEIQELQAEHQQTTIDLRNYFEKELENLSQRLNLEFEEKKSEMAENIELIRRENQNIRAEMAKDKEIINQLTEDVAVSHAEIVDYVSSTSWKITRPFRKLLSKIKGR